jgi:acyl CoA:acetate/3-ketoacid CoA transferase alpha subunit
MAGAGKITIAEVEELLPVGSLDQTKSTFRGFWCNGFLKGRNLRSELNREQLEKVVISF